MSDGPQDPGGASDAAHPAASRQRLDAGFDAALDLGDPQLASRILAAAPVIALLLDAQGRVRYLNPFAEALLGFSAADLTGQDWFSRLLPADEVDDVRARFDAVMGGAPSTGGSNATITRDGRRLMVEWNSQCLSDGQGRPAGLLAIGRDVTAKVAAEAELLASEQRYRAMFDANPRPMWVYERDSLRFLAVNDAAVRAYGYERDEFLRMTLIDIRPPAEHARLLDNVRQQAAGLEAAGIWTHRLKDGRLREVRIASHDLHFDGRPARLVLADDVTEQRALERQLKQAHDEALVTRDHLQDVLSRIEDGFVVFDAQWHYRYLNPRAARLLGREQPSDLLGRHIWTEYPDAIGGDFHTACEEAMRSQQPRSLEQHFMPGDLWFENRMFPSPTGLSVYFTDITHRKQAEALLQRSEQRLRHFFDAGQVGMAITQPSKQWSRVNARFCELLGYDEAELRHKTWAELTHPDDLHADVSRFELLMKGELDHYCIDKRYLRRDGSVLEARLSVSCERNTRGQVENLFAIVEDIGEQRRVQASQARQRDELERRVAQRTAELEAARDAAERADLAKSELMSRTSHELRTPLNAILGFSQLMAKDAGLPPNLGSKLDEVLRAGHHLLALINDMLDLASAKSGTLALSPEPVALDELVTECLGMIAPAARARHIRLQAGRLQALAVRADRTRLRQVLLNLLSNAVKYNHEGGQVDLQARRDADQVRLEIDDTGPGVPAGRAADMFQPFQRLGAEHSGIEGTGMGLAIARQLVELMQGRIGVSGNEAGGARFWVELPAASLAPSPAAGASAAATIAAPATTDPALRLLYIEDNRVNQMLLEQIVQRHAGVTLQLAGKAQDGLALASAQDFDLVLLDVHLPDADGYEVLAQLRSAPRTAALPVVMLSADAMPRERQRAIDAGCLDYITKPIDIGRIDALIQQRRALVRRSR